MQIHEIRQLSPGERFAGLRVEGVLPGNAHAHRYLVFDEARGRLDLLKLDARPWHLLDRGAWAALGRLSGWADGSPMSLIEAEAAALARCDHPAIPALMASSHDGTRAWSVTTWFSQGVNAHRGLAALTPAARLRVLAALYDALRHAHGRGIAHRDIKLSNLVLQAAVLAGDAAAPGPAACLIDFELAQVRGVGVPGAVGTRAYRAPETWGASDGGTPGDGRADLWALGVTAVALLTGAPPQAPLRGRPRWQGLEDDALDARLPAPLRAPLRGLLAFDPDARLSAAIALGPALLAAAEAAGLDPGALALDAAAPWTLPPSAPTPPTAGDSSDPVLAARRAGDPLRVLELLSAQGEEGARNEPIGPPAGAFRQSAVERGEDEAHRAWALRLLGEDAEGAVAEAMAMAPDSPWALVAWAREAGEDEGLIAGRLIEAAATLPREALGALLGRGALAEATLLVSEATDNAREGARGLVGALILASVGALERALVGLEPLSDRSAAWGALAVAWLLAAIELGGAASLLSDEAPTGDAAVALERAAAAGEEINLRREPVHRVAVSGAWAARVAGLRLGRVGADTLLEGDLLAADGALDNLPFALAVGALTGRAPDAMRTLAIRHGLSQSGLPRAVERASSRRAAEGEAGDVQEGPALHALTLAIGGRKAQARRLLGQLSAPLHPFAAAATALVVPDPAVRGPSFPEVDSAAGRLQRFVELQAGHHRPVEGCTRRWLTQALGANLGHFGAGGRTTPPTPDLWLVGRLWLGAALRAAAPDAIARVLKALHAADPVAWRGLLDALDDALRANDAPRHDLDPLLLELARGAGRTGFLRFLTGAAAISPLEQQANSLVERAVAQGAVPDEEAPVAVWETAARRLIGQGDPELAVEAARRARRGAPDDAVLWQIEAATLLVAGRWSHALACAREGLRRDPESAEGWLNAAAALDLGGLHELVVQAAGTAVQKQPGSFAAWIYLLRGLDALGETPGPGLLIDAVRLHGEHPEILERTARLAQRLGDTRIAVELAEISLGADPDRAPAWLALAEAHAARGDLGAALTAALLANRLSGAADPSLRLLTRLAIARGQHHDAVDAVWSSPTRDASILADAIHAARALNDDDRAAMLAARALADHPRHPEALAALLHAAALQARWGDAVTFGLLLLPADPDVYHQLLLAQALLGAQRAAEAAQLVELHRLRHGVNERLRALAAQLALDRLSPPALDRLPLALALAGLHEAVLQMEAPHDALFWTVHILEASPHERRDQARQALQQTLEDAGLQLHALGAQLLPLLQASTPTKKS